MTPSNGAGGTRSAPAASIVIPSAPPRGTLSKPVVCAGCPLNCWSTYHGPAASWACPFSPCLPRPSASIATRHARPRPCWTGPVRPPPDQVRQAALQIHRWLPGRRIVIVGDTAFAAIEFLAAVRGYLSVVTRLRLDANLYAPVLPRRPHRGRPPIKGKRLPKLGQVLQDPHTVWQRHTVTLWYGRTNRTVELATDTAVWYHSGLPPVPIRWLLVRDPVGELQPQAFLCTDLAAAPVDILQWFVSRW